MNHIGPLPTPVTPDSHGQQHSISAYLKVWGLLFVFSTLSYLVGYFRVKGLAYWVLIVILMIARAGLIVSMFMYMMWERLTLMYAILTPLPALLIPMVLMVAGVYHTFGIRVLFFH